MDGNDDGPASKGTDVKTGQLIDVASETSGTTSQDHGPNAKNESNIISSNATIGESTNAANASTSPSLSSIMNSRTASKLGRMFGDLGSKVRPL